MVTSNQSPRLNERGIIVYCGHALYETITRLAADETISASALCRRIIRNHLRANGIDVDHRVTA